jgi:hypothetical protein
MLGAVIPIHNLVTVREVERGLIPDPDGAIAEDLRILSLIPATAPRFGPHHFTEHLRPAQVGHIAVVHGVG